MFVQKLYLRTNYIEANFEEDIDLKNQFRNKNLPHPISIREACSKKYNDNLFHEPSIIKNTAHMDLNARNFINARFIQVNQLPQIDSHLTAKLYVDTEIHQLSLVRNIQDNDFNENNLINLNIITLNTQAVNDNHVITKAYIDQFHQENERSRRDVGLDFYDESSYLVRNNQDKDSNDNKLTETDSTTVNRNPGSDNELSIKKYVDDEVDKNNIVRFNQTLENYFKVSVGNDTYKFTKYKKIQITDTTVIRVGNIGSVVLPYWNCICNKKNNNAKITFFIKTTKTKSPTGSTGATSLPPVGSAFMHIETSGDNHGHNRVF